MHFEPLHPESRKSVIVGVVVGPLLWLVAVCVAAWFFEYSWAIAVGLGVTVLSFFLALVVLALIRLARMRREREYADSG